MIPILVNYGGSLPQKIAHGIKRIIKCIKEKYLEQSEEYAEIFNGYNFPQANEANQFIMVCEVIAENYICIDPFDNLISAFQAHHYSSLDTFTMI